MKTMRVLFVPAVLLAAMLAFGGCKSEPLTADSLMAMVQTGTPAADLIKKAKGLTFPLTVDQVATLREKGWTDADLTTIIGKAPPAKPIAVADFIKMVEAGTSPMELAAKVAATMKTIDLTDDMIQMLRTKGFTDEMIMAISGKKELPPPPPPPMPVTDGTNPCGAPANPCAAKPADPNAPTNVVVKGDGKNTNAVPVAPKAPTGVTVTVNPNATKPVKVTGGK